MSSKAKKSTTNEDGKHALVPKLRFPEFQETEGWNVTALNVIAGPVTDRAIQGEENNILSLSAEHGIVLQNELFGKKVAGDNSERYLKIARNDFVYNDRTTKASTFGTIKRLSKYSGGIVSPIYKCFRFQGDENPVFWDWYFESGAHTKALAGLVNEGARAGRFNISITQFLSTAAWRPGKGEQKQIAECLSSADELIAAQTRKLDALKTRKKGLMQQLFPREGETKPRLRFPEFQDVGEWENIPLGDKVDLLSGYPFDGPDISQDSTGVRLLRGINVTEGRIRHTQEIDRYYTGPTAGLEKFKVQTNDLVIGMDGSKVGKNSALVSAADDGSLLIQRVARLRTESPTLIQFIFQRVNSTAFHSYVDRINTSSGIPHISAKQIKEFLVCFPSELEQQRIALCLSTLDDLIVAESQKLETLKVHKRGLMQHLFPSPEEVEA